MSHERALEDDDRGLSTHEVTLTPEAMTEIAESAGGDARRALTILEAAAAHVGAGGEIDLEVARAAQQFRTPRYAPGGAKHYDIRSAYHKPLRGFDPDGALTRMGQMPAPVDDP